jgi:hypothetical protein
MLLLLMAINWSSKRPVDRIFQRGVRQTYEASLPPCDTIWLVAGSQTSDFNSYSHSSAKIQILIMIYTCSSIEISTFNILS